MSNSREITVSIGNYRPIVLNSSAKNLGELKQELNNEIQNGSYSTSLKETSLDDYVGSEGNSYLQLESDDTLLPLTVERDGEVTDKLLILMYPGQSKNKFGATRSELYDKIKSLSLQDEVKAAYGKNYTNVPTVDLQSVVDGAESSLAEQQVVYQPAATQPAPATEKDIEVSRIKVAISLLLNVLVDNEAITPDDADYVQSYLSKPAYEAEPDATYSAQDIEIARAKLHLQNRY